MKIEILVGFYAVLVFILIVVLFIELKARLINYYIPNFLSRYNKYMNTKPLTDKEKFITLMNEFGVGASTPDYEKEGQTIIMLEEGNAKINGYSSFFTHFCFNEATGEFIEVSIWES
jgi:hypothetical protein